MKAEDLLKIFRDAAGEEFAERAEEARRKAQEPVTPRPEVNHNRSDEDPQFDPSTKIARCVRYLHQAGGNKHVAMDIAHKAKDSQVLKALGQSTLAGGGAVVDGDFSPDIVPVLRDASVIRSLNPGQVPMNGGSLTLPYGATGASASYVGENTNATKTEPTFGQINLLARKLVCLVPTSNELLADSSGRADAFIRDDIANAMADKENSTLIRSDGSGNSPTGLLHLCDSANKFNANGTVSVANVTTDLGKAVRYVKEAKVNITRGGWVFDTRTEFYLMTARDGNNNLVWQPEMARGTLMGFPYRVTTAIPNNLGGGTNESEVYFANFDSLILAESDSMELAVFPGGAYHDGSNVISGISQDQTVIRATARHDFNARFRGKEISVIEAVTWGA